ncbi:MAG: Ig-like domain-containing protein, partial [Gemmatimonadaceae bacterium]
MGDTIRFSANAYDAKGNVIYTTVSLTWKSTDSTVATVTDSGLVTAKDTGSTTITATSGAISGTATVTVKLPLTTAMASVAAVTAGFSHTCGLVAGGVAYCWGSNARGQLGVDSTAQSVFPQPVSGGFTFASLALGFSHSCGLTAAGAAYCWGDNESGELGNTTSGTSSSTPVPVAGGLSFAMLSAGY